MSVRRETGDTLYRTVRVSRCSFDTSSWWRLAGQVGGLGRIGPGALEVHS